MDKVYVVWCVFMLVHSLVWLEASGLGDFGEKVQTGLLEDVNTITNPINSAVLTTITSDCESVKRLFHITYEQLRNEDPPDVNNLKIYFKTKEGQTIYNINDAAKELLGNPNFKPSYKVAIFIHGFLDNPTTVGFQIISDAFLSIGGYNVLALDASSLTDSHYLLTSSYVKFIGDKFGEFLVELTKGGIKEDDITLIGHSLGSHIASLASNKCRSITGKLLGRITGLDPGGPCFQNLPEDMRLKKTDAKFVDGIHTNAGVFGTTLSVGHVDYYPNGGRSQPDCLIDPCSHNKAMEYYGATVQKPDLFIGKKCKCWDDFKKDKCDNNDTNFMGFAASPTNTGDYYLVTSGKFPYGLGKEGLNYNGGNGILHKIDYRVNNLFGDDNKGG